MKIKLHGRRIDASMHTAGSIYTKKIYTALYIFSILISFSLFNSVQAQVLPSPLPPVLIPPTLLPGGATPGGVVPEREITTPTPDFPKQPEIDIPEQKPQAVDAGGARITISKINLGGAVDHAEKALLVSDIDAMLAEAISQQSDWSLAELSGLAVKVTDYYRQRGFLLSRAYLPAQSVKDGIIEMMVVEGKLGKLIIEGNEKYKEEVFQAVFISMLGQVLENEALESALLTVNEFPGLTAKAALRKGEAAGTADLVYVVAEEDSVDGYFNLDNYGSEYVGEARARFDLVWNNPTGNADRLTLSALKVFDPTNSNYGGFDYNRPHFKKNGEPVFFGFSGSYNEFKVGRQLEELGITGESARLDLYARSHFKRSRLVNYTYGIALSRKRSITEQKEIKTSQDDLTVLQLDSGGLWQNSKLNGGLASAKLFLAHGFGDLLGAMPGSNAPTASRLGGNGELAGGDFNKLNIYTSHFQRLSERVSTSLRIDGQWSNDLLVSLEQFPLGGPNSVRAYPLSAFLMDKGYFASAELSYAFNNKFQASAFVDHGAGLLNQPLISDIGSVDLSGAGLSLRISMSERFSILASAARKIGNVARGFESSKNDTRYFVALSSKLF